MWMSKINNEKVIPGNCFLLGRSIRHLYCPSGYITIYTRATALKLGKLIRCLPDFLSGNSKKILHELWPLFPFGHAYGWSTNAISGKNNFHVQGTCINTLSKFSKIYQFLLFKGLLE